MSKSVVAALVAAVSFASSVYAQDANSAQPGTVAHIKVLSDKVPDVSSLESWKNSFIKPEMSNQEKGLAIWKSVIMFQLQDSPPAEYLTHEDIVYDPIKMFNVYGYAMCSPHSAHMNALTRYIGFEARGWGISHHSVCEMYYDNAWHHFDSSLMAYFLKDDKTVASIDEVIKSVQGWYAEHPEFTNLDEKTRDKKLREFEFRNGRTGWKDGPKLIGNSPCYNAKGWWPAGSHGWYATMQAFDGTATGSRDGKAFFYEYSASMGYELNLQLRPGEVITRNWSNNGHHINEDHAGKPAAIDDNNIFLVNNQKFVDGLMPEWKNLTNGRVGNGSHVYNVPLGDPSLKSAALQYDNLAVGNGTLPLVFVKDASQPGVLTFRMPSSYVYLGGKLSTKAVVGEGGQVKVEFSDNNGLDWKNVATLGGSGEENIDLTKLIARRYDYRLRFTLKGKGTGLSELSIAQDIQHSQRPLPALDKGPNKISFAAGPQESTVTIEANNNLKHEGKQVTFKDCHPTIDGLDPSNLALQKTGGTITFPISTPGEMTKLHLNACYRTMGDKDKWDFEVSYDNGKTFKKVGEAPAQKNGRNAYVVVNDVPAGTTSALVRYKGTKDGGNILMSFRISADYKTPSIGFRPVKVTYLWDENGAEKKDVHVATKADETYTINCENKPKMKSLILELAQ